MFPKLFELLFGSSEYVWVAYKLPRRTVDGIRTTVLIQNKFAPMEDEVNENQLVETYLAEGLQRDLIDLHGPKIVNIRPRMIKAPVMPDPEDVEPDGDGRPVIAPRRRQLRL